MGPRGQMLGVELNPRVGPHIVGLPQWELKSPTCGVGDWRFLRFRVGVFDYRNPLRTHAACGGFRDLVGNRCYFTKISLYLCCHRISYSIWLTVYCYAYAVIFCIVKTKTFFLHEQRFSFKNRSINHPLDDISSGISNFGPTPIPTWEVGLLGDIAWMVLTPRGGTHTWV